MDGVPYRLRPSEESFRESGAENCEKRPIGTGPYMVDEFEGNALPSAQGLSEILGPQARIRTVIFKFVPDPSSRRRIESGYSDITLEIPYEEYDRLRVEGRPER